MDLERRIDSFLALAASLRALPEEDKMSLFAKANYNNPWFTNDNLELAWSGFLRYLQEVNLRTWLSNYNLDRHPKRVGVVMAGNIPMVGMHDFLCVLLSGHTLIAKLSSQDEVLIKFISDELCKIQPEFRSRIVFIEQLNNIDAVIATGSDNTSRYFEYYFSKYPHIIRKNRTSIAVLSGKETGDELRDLGHDIFSYFGMGCRNVSKIFLPRGYQVNALFKYWENFQHLAHHNKYANNYHYQRAILLVNQQEFLDTGFTVFIESDKLVSPLAAVYYAYYSSADRLENHMQTISEKLQCIVASDGRLKGTKKFGTAQTPDVMDYADNIDTLKFLTSL